MTTATLRISTPLPATREKTKATTSKGWLTRAYEAFLEGRMRAAMRELERHRHLIPPNQLKSAGYEATANNDGAFPFTR